MEQQDSPCNLYPEEEDKNMSENLPSLESAPKAAPSKESTKEPKQSLKKRANAKKAKTCISEAAPLDCKRKRASGRLNIQSQVTSDSESKPVAVSSQSKRIQKKRGSRGA